MKVGKWLAATGFVLVAGYLTAAEVAGRKTPLWPYLAFGAITVAGAIVMPTSLLCRRCKPAGKVSVWIV
jgi:hypothetical protein